LLDAFRGMRRSSAPPFQFIGSPDFPPRTLRALITIATKL